MFIFLFPPNPLYRSKSVTPKQYTLHIDSLKRLSRPIKEVSHDIDYYEEENPPEPYDERLDMLSNLRSVLGSRLFKQWAKTSGVEIYDV